MNGSVRVAAVGDLHCKGSAPGSLQALFSRVAENADVLALCGDLTDRGLPEEARLLAKELQAVKIPKVAVLGNHDYESEASGEVINILAEAQVTVLDGTALEIAGIGFAGAKGFGGGFGDRALQAWGEAATKVFVREVLLHYSPVIDTVDGEPSEIYPFLGSSRLEEPVNRYAASVVFHGHAHRGQPEGKTAGGIPVYNVALPLLQRLYPDRSPFRVVEIPAVPAEPAPPPVTVKREPTQ